jgi:group I intron endonuclease
VYSVYKHTTPNNKVYIGITKNNPEIRWANGLGYSHQIFFRAIVKYGWENIKHEILYTGLTKEQAIEKEIELIRLYDSTDPDKGYNITEGGISPLKTDSIRKRVSYSKKGKPQKRSKPKGKKVLCINTGEIFESTKKASEWAGVSHQLIAQTCRINKHTAGKHPMTGEPLRWRYIN